MKIIIAPAKKMRQEVEDSHLMTTPVYLNKAGILLDYLKRLSYDELKKLLVCNDEIATLNFERFKAMDFERRGNAALLSYDGIAYQYMAPQIFEEDYYVYVSEHLRILSGFYGILKPFDEIHPYRLEMQARLKTDFCKNLYDFWKDDLYQALTEDDHVILNLASKEYSKAVSKYLTKEDIWIDCLFGEFVKGTFKEKGVYVKMARGEMVRYMAENKIENIEDIKDFDRLEFRFDASLSNENKYVFVRKGN